MKRIYLYGIAGVADHYKVVRYSCVDSDGMTIMALPGMDHCSNGFCGPFRTRFEDVKCGN